MLWNSGFSVNQVGFQGVHSDYPCDYGNNNRLPAKSYCMASGKKCDVCDYVNLVLTAKCKNCNARLMKKRPQAKSKKTKSKAKYNLMKNMCKGKTTYSTKGRAIAAAKTIQKKTGRMSKIYGCKMCNGFHLTKLRS